MEKYFIRKAVEDDYEKIRELIQIFHDQHVAYDPFVFKKSDSVLTKENFTNQMTEELQFYAVACENESNQIVAVIVWEEKDYPDTVRTNPFSSLNINSLTVNDGYKRQGIGKMLIEYLITYAKNKKMDMMNLKVKPQNHEAIAFYKNMGLEEELISMRMNF